MTEARRIGVPPEATPDLDSWVDPDLDAPNPSAGGRVDVLSGLLEDLTKQLTADVNNEPVVLPVLKRPGVSVRYRTELDEEQQLNRFRLLARDSKAPDGFNSLRFCCMVLAATSDGFLMGGTEVFDEAGQPLTFAHKKLRTLYGAQRAADVARKVIGNDAHVMIAANAVLDAAGYGDQAVPVDGEGPTTGS